ncbi:MAG: DegQ family serine endoprotease [Nitrospirae bacterium]|nr:DegQ family serine endoprotease [Nitrospirota bacterium]
MKKNILLGLLILLIGFLLGGLTYYTLYERINKPTYLPYRQPEVSENVRSINRDFADVVRSVSPAVVNISTTKRYQGTGTLNDGFFDFFNPFHRGPRQYKEQSLGSGVIISQDGYIITNHHVIEQADEIRVTLYDRRSFKARVVGADPKTDIALIKIKESGLPTIPWGNSDTLSVGEFVLAIGNPFGLSHTVTMGIVSAVGRANVGIADYEDFIQTDAAINPGNSGGPLVNTKGELVGINTAIFSRSGGYQGIGFAVPSNMVRAVIEQLMKKGKVVRGWLGVTIQDLTPELAREFGINKTTGALVSDVLRGSPADRAGIKRGDVIVRFDNKTVENVSMLRNLVAQSPIGSRKTIEVIRNRRPKRLTVVVAELPKEFNEFAEDYTVQAEVANALYGVTVTDITPAIARQLGVSLKEKGVVVVDVQTDSPAHDAGLKKGDIIQEIDSKDIKDYDSWKEALNNIKEEDTVVLLVNRRGKRFYLAITP